MTIYTIYSNILFSIPTAAELSINETRNVYVDRYNIIINNIIIYNSWIECRSVFFGLSNGNVQNGL